MEKTNDKDIKDAEEKVDSLFSSSSTVAHISTVKRHWRYILATTDKFKKFTSRSSSRQHNNFLDRYPSLNKINQNSYEHVNSRRCNKERKVRNRKRSILLSAYDENGNGAGISFSQLRLSRLVCINNALKLKILESLRPPEIERVLYFVSTDNGYSTECERAARRGNLEKRFFGLEQRKESIQVFNGSMLKYVDSSSKNMKQKPPIEIWRGSYLCSNELERNCKRCSYDNEFEIHKIYGYLAKYERSVGRRGQEEMFVELVQRKETTQCLNGSMLKFKLSENDSSSKTTKQFPFEMSRGLYLVSHELESNSQGYSCTKETRKFKKDGFLAKYKRALRRAQQEKRFVEFEERKGMTHGLNGSILRREYSYGVDLAEVQLIDGTKRCFLLYKPNLMEKGTKIVTVADYFRGYKFNNSIVFIQPFKVIEL